MVRVWRQRLQTLVETREICRFDDTELRRGCAYVGAVCEGDAVDRAVARLDCDRETLWFDTSGFARGTFRPRTHLIRAAESELGTLLALATERQCADMVIITLGTTTVRAGDVKTAQTILRAVQQNPQSTWIALGVGASAWHDSALRRLARCGIRLPARHK